jgi:hypothetical protein
VFSFAFTENCEQSVTLSVTLNNVTGQLLDYLTSDGAGDGQLLAVARFDPQMASQRQAQQLIQKTALLTPTCGSSSSGGASYPNLSKRASSRWSGQQIRPLAAYCLA